MSPTCMVGIRRRRTLRRVCYLGWTRSLIFWASLSDETQRTSDPASTSSTASRTGSRRPAEISFSWTRLIDLLTGFDLMGSTDSVIDWFWLDGIVTKWMWLAAVIDPARWKDAFYGSTSKIPAIFRICRRPCFGSIEFGIKYRTTITRYRTKWLPYLYAHGALNYIRRAFGVDSFEGIWWGEIAKF